ncbi:MAG: CbbQ/NirQ/NorQ/GpvN family protein [Gammaproteobacteria bacterium]|nr:CbbQ/NirQ/NorQ/GpvN family protein [Gammaproteobacteria bacterium]
MPLTEYLVSEEPYYKPVGNEIVHYEAAHADRMPIVLKGPTGCGKTRFIEYMAWKLKIPMITVSCHEDMTASDLVGRFLLDAEGTVWHDGPLTLAVRHGAICYLDEIVEARQDTSVVIHSLSDHRRMLSLEKKNEVVKAHPDFHLVISYNPGYQSLLKDLKESTKQRFGAINFSYPKTAVEAEIVSRESGVDLEVGVKLVKIAERSRNLKGQGLEEGCSTRMLIHVGKLINRGIPLGEACEIALVSPLTDDLDIRRALGAAIAACA